jgi:polygalacturonase
MLLVSVAPPLAGLTGAAAQHNCTPEAFGGKADGSDATDAIQQAIGSCGTVVVGTGTYRIDGTLVLKGKQNLHLTIGATLAKGEGTAPVVRLDQLAVLDGRGTVSSGNPAPRGIVLIGPASTGYATSAGVATHKKDCSSVGNVLFATVDGITVHGSAKAVDLAQNPPWTPNSTVVQCGSWVGGSEHAAPQMSIGGGQIGICLDSGEITCGGACSRGRVCH